MIAKRGKVVRPEGIELPEGNTADMSYIVVAITWVSHR